MIWAELLPPPEFSDLDRHFAGFMARFGGDERLVPLAAGALSKSVRAGHTCLPLDGLNAILLEARSEAAGFRWPAAAGWRTELLKSKAVGSPEAETPLVLDGANRLYLRRYWNYQMTLARSILDKCSRNPALATPAEATPDDVVHAALRNELTIICGGPGTGKTSTVIRLLERLVAASGPNHPRIALAAPTGKAAARLEEALRDAAAPLLHKEVDRSSLPKEAKTIDRLLGRKPRSTAFRHNAENPLPLDVLIIDEASMAALALLAKLFAALPRTCRVILLGDRDQLASVEPGTVLADLVDAAASPDSPLKSSVVTLSKNYRFSEQSGIQQACQAVRLGDIAAVMALLRGPGLVDLIAREASTLATLQEQFVSVILAGFADLAAEREPAAALSKLRQFRVLTPLRHGPWGVAGLNRLIVKALATGRLLPERAGAAYPGRPILISQNDYELGLYNGDLGVLLPDPAATGDPQQLYAWFLGKDNAVRRLAYARLPEHETAYAMTVHKSQGSEFDRLLFVLPPSDSLVLTRELIYTALTRARSAVHLCWNEPVLSAAVSRRAQRQSGLRDLLSV